MSSSFTLSPLSEPFNSPFFPITTTTSNKTQSLPARPSQITISQSYDSYLRSDTAAKRYSTSSSSSTSSQDQQDQFIPIFKLKRPRGGKRARRAGAAKLRRATEQAKRFIDIENIEDCWNLPSIEISRAENYYDSESDWEELASEIEISRAQF